MTTLIEPRLLFFQHEVARCIKDPAVVSHLAAEGAITQDNSSRIKTLYLGGDNFKANEELINCLLKSKARGKWRSFLAALNNYHYLKSLLESSNRPDESIDRAREIIRLFTPYLENRINGKDIVTELYSRKVINQRDQELFLATCQNKGDTYGTIVLLEIMQCRLAPDEWYYNFLDVMVNKGYQHIVEDIEPEFLQCPDQFRPVKDIKERKQMIQSLGENEGDEQQSCSYNVCPTIEHTITEYVDPEEDMDDTAAPESDTVSETNYKETKKQQTDSSNRELNELSSEKEFMNTKVSEKTFCELDMRPEPDGRESNENTATTKSTKTENLKEFNIKPEISKSLSIGHMVNETSAVKSSTYHESEVINDIEQENDSDSDNDYIDPGEEKVHLRKYQVELAEKHAIKGKNTIICCDTGTGKTHVAMYIIDKHLQGAVDGNLKVAFIARTGALIKQQSDSLKKYLDTKYRIKLVTSETEESVMLAVFLDGYDIFCFTPQILVNNLDNKGIDDLSVFSLLVFDECHHTRKNEPYNKLMRRYLVQKIENKEQSKRLPQIVGLTASIGVGKASGEPDAIEHIIRVCARLDVRHLSTVENNTEELKNFTSIPTEESIPMLRRDSDPCKTILLSAMDDIEDILQERSLLLPQLVKQTYSQPSDKELQSYGTWANTIMAAAQAIVHNQRARDVASCARYLQIYCAALEVNRLLRTEDVALYLAEKHQQEADSHEELTETEKTIFQKLLVVLKKLRKEQNDNPNVNTISNLLRKDFDSGVEDSRAMVFVQARATCRALADFLDKEFNDIGVRASPLYGKENKDNDNGMTESTQTDIINKFRDGYFKVLVATSVGIEGIDVPSCNISLNYNSSGNEITKIQMEGRSRKKNGKAFTIGNEMFLERERINVYRANMMRKAIKQFNELKYETICRKVLEYQRGEVRKYQNQQETVNLKRSRQSSEIDYKVLCRDCNLYLCNTSNIRRMGSTYMVADSNFQSKIKKKPHSSPKKFGPIQKQFKIYCKECPLDLGII